MYGSDALISCIGAKEAAGRLQRAEHGRERHVCAPAAGQLNLSRVLRGLARPCVCKKHTWQWLIHAAGLGAKLVCDAGGV
jgi:hypothetical protein